MKNFIKKIKKFLKKLNPNALECACDKKQKN